LLVFLLSKFFGGFMESQIGFYRLPQILEMLPVSKSSFWARVKSGEYPITSVKLGPRTTAWRKSDIIKLAEKLGAEKGEQVERLSGEKCDG
jgi:predicted DNA-binding transcriptional regulator AlpA